MPFIKSTQSMRTIPMWIRIAPLVILGGVLLLSTLLIMADIANSRQNKERTFLLFEEKANSLIYSFEAALFVGYGFSWTSQELQTLLNEQANLADIHFLAITDTNSTVIASSEQSLVGQRLITPEKAATFTPSVNPESQQVSFIVKDEDNNEEEIKVFQVYRELLLPRQTNASHRQMYRFFLPSTPMLGLYENNPNQVEDMRAGENNTGMRNGGGMHNSGGMRNGGNNTGMHTGGGMHNNNNSNSNNNNMRGRMHNNMEYMHNTNQKDIIEGDTFFFPLNSSRHLSSDKKNEQYIMFVGFDAKEIKQATEKESRRTSAMKLILVFIGIITFVSLFVIRAYLRSIKMIQEGKAFTLALVDTLPLGIITLDVNKKILTLNSEATAITHIYEEDILSDALSVAIPQLADLELDPERVIEKNIICQFDEHTATPLEATTFPINSQEDRYGYAIILRDLSEIQRLEKALHRQERLAGLGNMAAGIAHEIRNPLGSIKGLAKYFEESVPKDSEDAKLAAIMTQEVLRMDKVVGDLLELAKPDSISCTSFPLIQLFNDTKAIIERDLSVQNISWNLNIDSDLSEVYLDFDRAKQILLNVFLNSIQAMPNGGSISITAKKEHNFITITIEDTGEGIEAQQLSTIFSPYYTTKAKGTGLGLSMVQKYVEAHDGQIEIQSEKGKGTSVLIHFPQITQNEVEND